jgi:hypothetical protein
MKKAATFLTLAVVLLSAPSVFAERVIINGPTHVVEIINVSEGSDGASGFGVLLDGRVRLDVTDFSFDPDSGTVSLAGDVAVSRFGPLPVGTPFTYTIDLETCDFALEFPAFTFSGTARGCRVVGQ